MTLTEPPTSDTTSLTVARLRQMSSLGEESLPPVPTDGLPPGPEWPALVQTLALFRFRHRLHGAMQRRYGDVFTLRLVPNGRPLVIFTRPDHAREIFAGDPQQFLAGKGNAVLGPIMGEHSLLLQDRDEHHRARKLLMPAFNGKALRSYRSLVAEVAAAEIDGWRDGQTFRSLDRMNALTLEVILRVVFGVSDEARLAQLRPRVTSTVEISPVVLLGWAYPQLQRFGPWRRTIANQIALDRLMYAEIRDRRAAGDLPERRDVLSRLLQVGAEEGDALGDTELRDQLVTLLLAGHETTASALSWALYEVGRSASLRERCRRAADEGDDDWLEAVMKESMRLHPIIPMVVRTLTRPTSIGGVELPPGVTVGPSIILAHSSDDNHVDPEAFRPERFLGGAAPAPNTWIPFGGGVRRCIGAGFAQMEGTEILRQIFRRYDVTSLGADRPKVRNITSVPRHGSRIRLTARR
jgi:cytochrome P450